MDVVDIFVPLDDSGGEDASSGDAQAALVTRAEQALGWARGTAGELRVVRRSLDARKKHAIGYRLRVEVARKGEALPRAHDPTRPACRPRAGPPGARRRAWW